MKLRVMKYLPANYQLNGLGLYDFFFYADEARRSEARQNARQKTK